MTKKIRFEGIDFLKFFAIFGVVCLHVAGSYFNVGSQSENLAFSFLDCIIKVTTQKM